MTPRTPSAWLAVAISLLNISAGGGLAQPSLDLLNSKTRDLRKQLCDNVKVAGSVAEYDTDPMGKYLGRCDFTLLLTRR